LAIIPVFLVLALGSGDGRDTTANALIFVCGASDYLDGLVARATGQFSRLGSLLDPLVDRLLIIAAAVVIYRYELVPRWIVVLIFVREAAMLVLSALALRAGLEIKVNWIGRLAVWPLMLGGFLALCTATWVAEALMIVGAAGSYAATYLYVRSALRAKPQPEVEA